MDASPITHPALVLIGLGAFSGLLAAASWIRVATSIDESGEVVKGPDRRRLGQAAALTAIALGLASFGYLLGVFTNHF